LRFRDFLPANKNARTYRFKACSFDSTVSRRMKIEASLIINTGESVMRFMVMVKATKESEAGVMPSEQMISEMTKFNEELVKAGVMLAGEGLQPSSKGTRVAFTGNKRSIIDGPFAETKELVAGFWIWQVKSKEEAIEWARRCPNPMGDAGGELELRPMFEMEDFGEALTPELKQREAELRQQIEAKK
jgi:hypothetical protein